MMRYNAEKGGYSMDQTQDINQALEAAKKVTENFEGTRALPSYRRAEILQKVSEKIKENSEDFARLICEEVKKPLKEARREVSRAVFTFNWAAEEAKRFGGEVLPLDLDKPSIGRLALTRPFPRGPALLISPFNFPLNLVAHKVAPAMALGIPFVLKPAPQSPKTAQKLMEIIFKSDWPQGSAAALSCSNEAAERLVQSDLFAILSFTGSAQVGWRLKALSGKKHVVLELGGTAPLFIDQNADLAFAAQRAAWGAFYYSGQVCISVQRILVAAACYEPFKDFLLKEIAALKVGDPRDENTDIGPLIDQKSEQRVETWISEAVSQGARVLCGGKRRDGIFMPTLIENAPQNCKLSCEEVFGPVATLEQVSNSDEALKKMSEGAYGLQAGIFTNDLRLAHRAWDVLPFGGVIINDIPAFRSDAMPYGGNRSSGIGREGVRYAMEEYSQLKTLVLNFR